jgi:branched-subunit amino acid aminotransferase/4-amino-4-deoxychorismate lyase
MGWCNPRWAAIGVAETFTDYLACPNLIPKLFVPRKTIAKDSLRVRTSCQEDEKHMTPQQPPPANEWSWANPALRQQLLNDPLAVLKDRGINVPAEVPLPIIHEFVRIAFLLWVDGVILPVDRFFIDPSDEGLLFGRGAWESTKTIGGVPWLWSLHIERLLRTAELLFIDVAPERLPDSKQVSDYVRSLSTQDVIIRLNVTAGRPGKTGIVWMSAALPNVRPTAVRLRTCRSPVEKGQSYLTLKTFHYASRLRVGQQAGQAGFDTALLFDAEGNLLEASHANIFLRMHDGWATPQADSGFLPGTVRHYLLQRSPIPIRERVLPRTLLSEVQEAFVTNSNVGIVPVAQIDDRTLPIGTDTQKLIGWLEPPAPSTRQYCLQVQASPR